MPRRCSGAELLYDLWNSTNSGSTWPFRNNRMLPPIAFVTLLHSSGKSLIYKVPTSPAENVDLNSSAE